MIFSSLKTPKFVSIGISVIEFAFSATLIFGLVGTNIDFGTFVKVSILRCAMCQVLSSIVRIRIGLLVFVTVRTRKDFQILACWESASSSLFLRDSLSQFSKVFFQQSILRFLSELTFNAFKCNFA